MRPTLKKYATGRLSRLDLSQPGTYALLFFCIESATVTIGALGEVVLAPGYLIYVGSAFGPGGLAGRLRHHLRPIRLPRWHVDYIRSHVSLMGAWCVNGRTEHDWAAVIRNLPGTAVPKAGFGASDCCCEAHLFHLCRNPESEGVGERLSHGADRLTVTFIGAGKLEELVR